MIKRLMANALRRRGYEMFYASAPALKAKRQAFRKSPEAFRRDRDAMKVALVGIDDTYKVDGFWHLPEHHYVPKVYGTNAHKHLDIRDIADFGDLARQVRADKRTLLYYDRLHTLYQSLENIARRRRADASTREPINIAEVGVFRGGTSNFLSLAAKQLELDFQLHGFDTFEGHASEDLLELDKGHASQKKFQDTGFEAVREYLHAADGAASNLGDAAITLHQGRFQDNCARVEDLTFDLVHLDVDIYEPTRFALEFFDARLRDGGIIVVDDYGFTTCEGARQAVDEWVQKTPRYNAFHLLTGQCLLVPGARGTEQAA